MKRAYTIALLAAEWFMKNLRRLHSDSGVTKLKKIARSCSSRVWRKEQ